MPKIRVLIADDAVVIRRLLANCLAEDPDIEVVGTAPNGQIALAKIEQVNPDLLTLDIEMPVMDGLKTLEAIRKTHPRLPVIMFSTLTERGASATLDALSLGASDYVTKPANVGSVGAAMLRIREELIPKIKGLCRRAPAQPALAPPLAGAEARKTPEARPSALFPAEILAIGVSTGGPNALSTLLPGLPRDFPAPIVIVQHMPPLFTRLLAERLAAVSGLPAREGEAGALLRPGEIWVAPGGFHMEVERAADGLRLRTHQGPPENSCRPAVDVLFRSVARAAGDRVLGVVLTGMGSDGLHGCQCIREAGGQVLAQDEASSVVWGMPGAVSQAGLAAKVLPLRELAAEINRRIRGGCHQADPPGPAGLPIPSHQADPPAPAGLPIRSHQADSPALLGLSLEPALEIAL
jgi:two-component system chemotaxis response regulator CheB